MDSVVQEANPKVSLLPAFARSVAALGVSTLVVGGTAFIGIYAVQKVWGVNSVRRSSVPLIDTKTTS